MAKKMTELQQERLLHLSAKLVDYVYTSEYEDYWNSTALDETLRDDWSDDWIDEDVLNNSNHMFKIVYNLNKLILKIKSNA